MPSIYQLKSAFQQLLRPVVQELARRVTANQVTLLAMASSVAYGVALYCLPTMHLLWLCLPVFLFIRMALNAVDGMLAREFGQQSLLGGFLNELGDVVSDAALYLSLTAVAPSHAMPLVLITFLAALTEFTGVCGWALCGIRCYDGPLGKSDRAFLLGVFGLAVGLGASAELALNRVLLPMGVLLVWTTVSRIRHALRHAEGFHKC